MPLRSYRERMDFSNYDFESHIYLIVMVQMMVMLLDDQSAAAMGTFFGNQYRIYLS
jgi:hypothetical protein